MKKIFVLSLCLLSLCFVVTGCNKKNNSPKVVGGWETVLDDVDVNIDSNALAAFNNSKGSYEDLHLNAVALLASAVTGPKSENYLFLARAYPSGGETQYASYKIVEVYNDNGNATMNSVEEFDFTKYVNVDIPNNSEYMDGGWGVSYPNTLGKLDSKVQSIFDNVTSNITDITYNPIVVIAKQLVSGTNYAVLCYGKSSDKSITTGLYLLTLYEDLDGNQKLAYQAFIDVADLYYKKV